MCSTCAIAAAKWDKGTVPQKYRMYKNGVFDIFYRLSGLLRNIKTTLVLRYASVRETIAHAAFQASVLRMWYKVSLRFPMCTLFLTKKF